MLALWAAAGFLDAGISVVPGELIPLSLAKKHLRLEASDTSEDDLVELYLSAAIGHLDGAEGWLGRALVEREYVATFDCWSRFARLPYPPLVSVTGIECRAADGLWSAVDPITWEVVDGGIVPLPGAAWASGTVRVTYRAGYDPASDRPLPRAIVAAVLLMTEDLYRNRGEAVIGTISSTVAMSPTVQNLLSPFRVWRV